MTKEELIKYAEKRYPKDSFYKEVGYNSFEVSQRLYNFEHNHKGVFGGFGYVYTFKGKKWAENCDENGNIIPYIETKIIELW